MSTEEPRGLTLLEHLEDLRRRLLIILGVLLLTSLVGFAFAAQLITLLTAPIGGTQNLQAIQVTENVSVYMRVSLISGVILASPVILYQLLAFVQVGLEPIEKKYMYYGIAAATLLFLGGVAFAYFVMLPTAIPVLTDFMEIPNRPRPLDYIDFVTGLIFWLGVGFESPILIFLLAKLNLVTPRALAKNWRIAVVIIAVLAGLITPTVDPVSMLLLMAPLLALYALSVLLAWLALRNPDAGSTPG